MRLFAAFLHIALTGIVIITSFVNADEACTAAYDAARVEVSQGDSCNEVDGMCPDTCTEIFATLASVCAGTSYTQTDEVGVEFDQEYTVLDVAFLKLFMDGACVDADLMPGGGDNNSCDEAIADLGIDLGLGDSCREVDGMCPDTCDALFDAVDVACAGKSYSVSNSSEDLKYNRGQIVSLYSTYMKQSGMGTCADAIGSGAPILGTHASAALVTGSITLISFILLL
jgi:hypothetical protein